MSDFIEDDDDLMQPDHNDEIDDEYDEADAAFDAKEKKRKISKIINRVILIVSAAVFIFAAYNLISILLEYKKAGDIYHKIEDTVLDEDKPVTIVIGEGDEQQEVEIPFSYDHQALIDMNSDGVGFLYIPSLKLRLPIAQNNDNEYYLHHTFDGTYNDNGCLFIDSRIDEGLDASHVIIYGHSMNSGQMFGTLYKYKSYYFYATEGNDVFYIYTKDVIREYKIFSAFVCDPISDVYTFNFASANALREYAENMQENSLYSTGVDVSNADQIVTFSTCTNDSKERLIVQGVFIGESKIPDAN